MSSRSCSRAPHTRPATSVARRIRDALEQRFTIAGVTLDIEASIGIALYPEHAQMVDTLLQRADLAMYQTNERRSGYGFYSTELDHAQPSQLSLLGELRRAIENEELTLYYQPKAALHSGRVT
jgi:predicted signal transduction protein with EAL and GGDEF domain